MRRLSRTIAISGALAAVMALGSASVAVAAPLGGGQGSTRWVSVSVNGDGAGGGGGSPGCQWRAYAGEIDRSYANKFDLPSYQAHKDEPGSFYWVECPDGSSDLIYAPDTTPVVDPFVMANYALEFIDGRQATVNVNPARALVRLPTWFWVDDNAGNVVAVASVIRQTATVTAVPDRVVWHINGASKTCDYPGEAFIAGETAPTAESSCSKTFTEAANDVTATAQIIYRVTWEAEGIVNVAPTFLADLPGPVSPATNFDVLQVETLNK